MKHIATLHIGRQRYRQQANDQQRRLRMTMGRLKRMGVTNHHPIDIMHVGERSDAGLIRHEQSQQMQSDDYLTIPFQLIPMDKWLKFYKHRT